MKYESRAVKSNPDRMEEVIIANSNVQKVSLLSDNGIEASSGFVVGLLKERIVFFTKKLVEDNCQVASKGINTNVP